MSYSWHDKLSGVSFRQKEIDALTGDEELTLIARPDNEYDEYAVEVQANGVMIGWIRKGHNKKISQALQNGKSVKITDFNITGGEGSDENGRPMNYGVNVKIEMESEEDFSKFKKLVPDIGEGFVYFDEANHIYYNENGERMTSGSMMEELEVGTTDLSYAAEAMAKSTRIPKSRIIDMWEKNGSLSAQLGTVVHDAFDYYIKNQVHMKAYDAIKERPHSACNWFPNVVGKIIDEYLEVWDLDRSAGEVFIRFGNFCGFVDQLVYLDERVVVIRDYKIVNVLKKVKTKSFGSVYKYTTQQNTYRAILEANGYEVVAAQLNLYDGEEWKEQELEMVTIDVGQNGQKG